MLELYAKQMISLQFLIQHDRCLDRSWPGTGKTPPACVYTRYEITRKNARVIWIQPTSLMGKNHKELKLWAGLNDQNCQQVIGNPQQKRAICTNPEIKCWVLTADAWASEYGELIRETFNNVDAIVCDEPHMYYRGWTSRRTTVFFSSLKKNTRVKFLTGTPTPFGKLSSAYVYCAVIQPDYYQHYKYFMQLHAVYDEFDTVKGWQNHEILQKFIDHYSICHTSHDMYGDVKEFILREMVPLVGRHKKLYERYELDGVLDLARSITKNEMGAGSESLKVRQILIHPHNLRLPIKWDESGKPIEYEPLNLLSEKELTGKEERLINYFGEGKPLAVFVNFEPELKRIKYLAESQGLRVCTISGKISPEKRFQIDEDFQRGLYDVVVCTVKTASVGFNWAHLDTVIFHSMDYGDDSFTQAKARAQRGIREIPLRVVILEYEDTLESVVLWKVHHNSINSHKVTPSSPILKFPMLTTNPLDQFKGMI